MKLYPYQEEDVGTLLSRIERGMRGVANLSDTGTGKTPSTITLLERSGVLDDGYALIVAPKSLVLNWRDEYHAWYPGRMVVPLLGPVKRRLETLRRHEPKRGTVFLTNYHTVGPLANDLRGNSGSGAPGMVIADEAHRIKNRDAAISKALKGLPCGVRVGLTATPMDWKEWELWSILHWLDPRRYGGKPRGYRGAEEFWPFWKWAGKYGIWQQGRFGWEYVGPRRDRQEELARELRSYCVRRLFNEVATYFPDVQLRPVRVGWYPRQEQMHTSLRKFKVAVKENGDLITSSNVASQLVRLQQVADNPAIIGGPDQSEKMDYVLDTLATQRPIAVFSKYLAALDLLAPRLEREGYRVCWITGRQSDRARRVSYESVNNGRSDVVLCTYGAGAEGINLLLPRMVMLDQPWPYKDWYQATSRPRRPTNPHPKVTIDVLITEGSVDEYVYRILRDKQDVNDYLLVKLMKEGGYIT